MPAAGLALIITRSISGGMHEDIEVINYSGKPQQFIFGISIKSDFLDLLELKLEKSVPRGLIRLCWDEQRQELRTDLY